MTLSKTLSLFIVLGSTVLTSSAALALNIYNQDSKRYEVEINFYDGTTKGPLNANTRDNWYSGGCDQGCKVTVKNVGKIINVQNDDLVVIKDGNMTIVKSVDSQ